MPTREEMNRVELAMLYELRLIIDASDKSTYTKAEILALIDQIAISKK